MAGEIGDNPATVPPIETIIVSSIQGRWTGFTESFLREKYCSEKLSIAEIASLTFSAKSTVMQHLAAFGICCRKPGSTVHRKDGMGIAFGMKIVKRQLIRHQREQEAILKMQQLRRQGFTLEAIAEAFNTLGIPTKTGKALWSAKTIQQVLIANQG